MKQKVTISVIIPAFNEEKYLGKCLQALENQDFPKNKYEVIVVNNNSTDSTAIIAHQFKVKVILEKKRGLVMARNAGLRASQGKIIANLDADCIPSQNWLKIISHEFSQNPRLVFLTGPYLPPEGENNRIDYFNIKIFERYYQVFKKVIAYWGGNSAIKKKALLDVGGYNLSNPYHDELAVLNKLKKKGLAKYKRELAVISSNRRIKGRTLKFLIKEVLFLYLINNLYNRLTKKHWDQWETIR